MKKTLFIISALLVQAGAQAQFYTSPKNLHKARSSSDNNKAAAVAPDATTVATGTQGAASVHKNTLSGAIFANGSLSSLENLATPNTNLSLGGMMKYNRSSFYFAFNAKPAASNDSASTVKTFLFPEINSRAFVFAYYLSLNKQGTAPIINTDFFLSASTCFVKDTNNNLISPYNAMAGLKFTVMADLSNDANSDIKKLDHLAFSFSPYYGITTLDPKDFKTYDNMFDPGHNMNLQPTLHTAGAKFEFEAGHVSIFFDGKYILKANSNSVFNNSYWTVGTNINTNVFNFPSTSSKTPTNIAPAPGTDDDN